MRNGAGRGRIEIGSLKRSEGIAKMRRIALVAAWLGLVFVIFGGESFAASCSPSKTLSCGTTVTDSINANGAACVINTFPTALYAFNGTAGQTLDLLASDNSGFTIGLTVTDPTGKTITSDFDEPASAHAVLTVTGQYSISINFGNPHQSGSFTLATSCTTSTNPPPTQCNYTATVAIGSTVTGQLTANDAACGYSESYAKAYKLPVNAGDTFEVDYSSTAFNPFIEIKGPDSSLGERWVNLPATSLTTFYVAPTTGNVTIYAMSNNGVPVTGSFTVTILPMAQPSCGKVRAVRH